jgi:hypothetical protein
VPQLLIVSLSFSIINVRVWASASAANRAARSARSIAFSVVTSSGRESSAPISAAPPAIAQRFSALARLGRAEAPNMSRYEGRPEVIGTQPERRD